MSEPITNNRAKFVRDFGVLSSAGVAVTAVRTREPFRALQALKEYAFMKNVGYKVWTMLSGWSTYTPDMDDDDRPQSDGNCDVLAALKLINGVGDANNGFEPGVYCMQWPHWHLPRTPAMIQCVAEYAHELAQTKKRVVFLVPDTFELPEELSECVTFVDFDVPGAEELQSIAESVIDMLPSLKQPDFDDDHWPMITSAAAGLTEIEFESAVSRALVLMKDELPEIEIDRFTRIILEVKTEAIKRSEVLELMAGGTMEDIGGLDVLKEWTHKRIECFSKEAQEFGVDTPRGIALIGPPGTGKSACGKAIAHALGVPLIRFDIARVFNSLVGSSEGRVRAALKMLDAMAPCVCLVDEIDKALDTRSGGGDAGVGKRILGAILTHLQESGKSIFWVVTANRTETMPSELLRKGRLDEVFSVTIPNDEERLEVLRIHLRKRKQNPDKVKGLERAVEVSAGYVSAELEAAVKEAVLEAYQSKAPVTGELIVEQLRHMKPLSVAFKEDFEQMRTWAENNARPSSRKSSSSSSKTTNSADGERKTRKRRRLDAASLDG